VENFQLNILIVSWLNHWANSSLYASNLIIFFAVYLGWLMVAGLLFYIYEARNNWRAFRVALLALASGLLALLAADLIKSVYPVARPLSSLKGLTSLFKPGDIASFPSSHAAFFGGLAGYLFLRSRNYGGWYLLLVLLICVARVASGVHYPLDILAGLALAGLASLIFIKIFPGRKGSRMI